MSNEQLLELVQKQDITIEGMQQQIDGLKHQVEWFKRHFHSEFRRHPPRDTAAALEE